MSRARDPTTFPEEIRSGKIRMVGLVKNDQRHVRWRSLVRKSEFQKVYEQGAKRVGRLVVVYLFVPEPGLVSAPGGVPDPEPQTGLPGKSGGLPDLGWAVVASKKVGNAVARNRAKRLLREARRLGPLRSLGVSGELNPGDESGEPSIPDLADQIRRHYERFLRGPGGHQVIGDEANDQPAGETASVANETNKIAGLWVVLVARKRILDASSREVRDELDTLLGMDPQPH